MSLIKNRQYIIPSLILLAMGMAIVSFFSGHFIRHVMGDYLVVIFLYCLLRVFSNMNPYKCAVFVLIFSYSIEFLQKANIIEFFGLKQNLFLDLTLGSTFDWRDILAYSLGILTVVLAESIIQKIADKRTKDQSISK